MIFNIPPEINKEFILSQISEEEIFSYYGVPVVDCMFRSILRPDNNPTCSFYRSPRNFKLYLRDWNGDFWGDCFDLVMRLYGVSFYKALRIIAKDFGIIKANTNEKRIPAPVNVDIKVKEVADIKVSRRSWNKYDADYWKQFGIKKKSLEHFKVAPVQWVWLNGKIVYGYNNPQEVAYCYHFGNYNYKIYYPTRSKARFLHNDADILQGYEQLPSTGEALVITKSYKDVIKFFEFDILSVAPQSETMLPSDEIINEFKERFNNVFALYDNDRTGIRSLIKYRQKGIVPLLFPKNLPKDFTDFYKEFGEEETKILIQTVKDTFL